MGFCGVLTRLVERVYIFCRHTEQRDLLTVDEVEQDLWAWMKWGAIEEDGGRFGSQRSREPVPHHPSCGREVEDAISGTDVAVDALFADEFDEHSATPVDDRLWLGTGT